MRQRSLLVRYAAGLTFAYLVTVVEVVAIVVSLSGRHVVTTPNIVALVVLALLGTATIAVGAILIVAPSLRWVSAGRTPRPAELKTALRMMRRQSAITVAPWILTAVVLVAVNLRADTKIQAVIGSAILFGAIATVCTGFLFTMRTLRPLLAAVPADPVHPRAPGVRTRLLLMWTVCTALPGSAIAVLLVLQSRGWLANTPIEMAMLVLALVAVVLGLRAIILVSISISDPVGEVVDAMAEVEQGRLDHTVPTYEWSEIGSLQRGFNSMVAGLRERDRLRELFGRHVGEEVVRRAVEENESLSGDVREAAVLFIDLVGSTRLAVDRPPDEVAALLNDFFRIVVAEVDKRHGLINKFQGDAALAVFGAPLRSEDPVTAALQTARTLVRELTSLPIDFGVGVSAGPVFAGNIGAENRYEYTVVGDPVNEAARLADRAKEFDARVLCSGAALDRATESERRRWGSQGSEVLRGRSEPTEISTPYASPIGSEER